MINVQTFTIDIKKPTVPRLRLVSGDTANQFVITLKDDGAAVTLDPNLHKIIAVFRRSDGQVYTQDKDTDVDFTEGGIVTIMLHISSFTTGINHLCLQIYEATTESPEEYPLLLTTPEAQFSARASAIPDSGSENAPSQLPMLEQLISDAREAIDDCAEAVDAVEQALDSIHVTYVDMILENGSYVLDMDAAALLDAYNKGMVLVKYHPEYTYYDENGTQWTPADNVEYMAKMSYAAKKGSFYYFEVEGGYQFFIAKFYSTVKKPVYQFDGILGHEIFTKLARQPIQIFADAVWDIEDETYGELNTIDVFTRTSTGNKYLYYLLYHNEIDRLVVNVPQPESEQTSAYVLYPVKHYTEEAGASVTFEADTSEIHVLIEIYVGSYELNVVASGNYQYKRSSGDAPSPSSDTPLMDGNGSAGSSDEYARGDHRHPTDTTRAAVASPTFTGTPKAPTAATGTNTTQIATTAFVQQEIANLPSGSYYTLPSGGIPESDLSQAVQTKLNASGGSATYVITDVDSTAQTSSMTFAELSAALADGKRLIACIDNKDLVALDAEYSGGTLTYFRSGAFVRVENGSIVVYEMTISHALVALMRLN